MTAPYRPLYQQRPGPAPRPVPLGLRYRLRTGGALGIVGWTLTLVSSIVVWILLSFADVSALWEFAGELDTHAGTIESASGTNATVNNRALFKIHYRFIDSAGVERSGASYATHLGPWSIGTTVTIEHPAGDPSISRIQGARRKPLPGALVLLALLPLVGAIIAAIAWIRGRRLVRLMSRGEVGEGVLIGRRPTNVRINHQQVYAYTFEYEVEGRTYRVEARTHQDHLSDDDKEPLLYDPQWPRNATMLDHLPGGPQIDEQGRIVKRWGVGEYCALGLPVATVLSNAVLAAIFL